MARQLTRLVIAGLVALLAAIQSVAAQGPSASGLWQKIDEASGKPVVWFLFIDRGGVYEGIAAKLFQRPSDDPSHSICLRCRDDRKDASLLGLPIIRNMRRNGLRYDGGNILDPRDGKIYSAVMTISPDGQTLTVRGYLGFELLGRNDIWYRLPDSALNSSTRSSSPNICEGSPRRLARYLRCRVRKTVQNPPIKPTRYVKGKAERTSGRMAALRNTFE